MIVSAVRLAVRRLHRARTYAATVAVTLGIGIGVTGALFAVVHAVLIRPLPYRDAGRLVELRHEATRVELPMDGLSPGLAEYYRREGRSLENIGVYVERVATLSDLDNPERARVASVTPEVFAVLGPSPLIGRLLVAGDYEPGGPGRVVLSYALWVRRYGADSGIVGRTIEIDRNKYDVVGVSPPGFDFPRQETEAWVAWGWPEQFASRASLRSLAFGGVARLKIGVTVERAEQDLQGLVQRLPDRFSEVTDARLQEMGFRARVVPLKLATVGAVRRPLLLLLASAALLLLITWANVCNITLVRGERLRRDVAVAWALGATDRHVTARFVWEALLLAAGGSVLGIGLATLMINLRFGFLPEAIPRLREAALDAPTLALIIALSLASAALLAVAMLMGTARAAEVESLRGLGTRATGSRRQSLIRQVLVGGQVALALILLLGSALMAKSFWQLSQVRLGFESEGAFTFRLPIPPGEYSSYHASTRVHEDIRSRLQRIVGVEAVELGHASTFPFTAVPSFYQFRLTAVGSVRGVSDTTAWGRLGFATPGYFKAMGIPFLRGRTFQWEDTGRDGHGIVLSATLANSLFGTDNPIGRQVRWTGNSSDGYTVVGVVGDVPGERVADGASRAFYFPNIFPPRADTVTGIVHDYIPFDEVYVLRTQLPAASLLPAIHRAVREVDPKLTITRPATLARLLEESMASTRLTLLLLSLGALVAVLLGVVGIYGTLSYAVSLRRAELGIRLALGATPGSVARMVVRQGAVQAAGGILLGLVISGALGRYLRTVLYGVSPSDPIIYGIVAALLFAVALAASYLPARRAGGISPVSALKAE